LALNAGPLVQSVFGTVESFVTEINRSTGQPSDFVQQLFTLESGLFGVLNGFDGVAGLVEELGRDVNTNSFGPSTLGVLDSVNKLITLARDTANIIQDIRNLGNSVPDARQAYLDALQNELALREAYGRLRCRPDDPDPPPETEPRILRVRRGIGQGTSSDPNDKLTVGVSTGGHIRSGDTITYTVRFENMPTATLPAQEVFVTDLLSGQLDWSTLELISIGFNNVEYELPAGLREYQGRIDVPTDSFPADTTVTFDNTTGELHWYMRSVDPLFGGLPEVPEAGFLPPNDATGQGEGFLIFRVQTLDSLTTGDVINNQASIVFDDNAAIVTNITVNTIDEAPPTSAVNTLDEAYGTASFSVDWSGQDNAGGSGIASYDVFVSVNDGAFESLLTDTTETSLVFTGESGSTYGFATVARDTLGNLETPPTVPDTETLVIIGAWTNPVNRFDVSNLNGVTAQDALLIINELARKLVHDPDSSILTPLPPDGFAPPFYDVTTGGRITALDALQVINELARLSNSSNSVPAAEQLEPVMGNFESPDWFDNLLLIDTSPDVSFDLQHEENVASVPPAIDVGEHDPSGSGSPELDSVLTTLADDVAEQWTR